MYLHYNIFSNYMLTPKGSLSHSLQRMEGAHLISSYSIFYLILIVQYMAPGFIYYTKFKHYYECINFFICLPVLPITKLPACFTDSIFITSNGYGVDIISVCR